MATHQELLREADQTVESLLSQDLGVEVSQKLKEAGFRKQDYNLVYTGKRIKINYYSNCVRKGEMELEIACRNLPEERKSKNEARGFLSKLITQYLENI